MGRAASGGDRAVQEEKRRRNRRAAFQLHRQRRTRSRATAGADAYAGPRRRRTRTRIQETAQMVLHWPILSLRKTTAWSSPRTFSAELRHYRRIRSRGGYRAGRALYRCFARFWI